MILSPKQIGMILAALFVVGVIVFLVVTNQQPPKPPAVSLIVWGTDPGDVIDAVIKEYKKIRPNVSVQYQAFDDAVFDDTLTNALASGQGPDAYMIRNRALPRERSRLKPVSASQLSLAQFKSSFPTVAEQDFVSEGNIYALPLYVDTLALFYNRDMFDRAAMVKPPATWIEVRDAVPKLRTLKADGKLDTAAIALGGSLSGNAAAVDTLNLLMLQNGTAMTDAGHSNAAFASGDKGFGTQAFTYYLQFSNPSSPYYSWSDGMGSAEEAFSGQKAAMLLAYHDTLTALKNKSPFLNVGIASAPQTNELRTDYARYKGFAVSKQSKSSAWAWDFVMLTATNVDIERAYLAATNRPPALRSLIKEKLGDVDFGPFAAQALTARSWYEADDRKINGIFDAAIKEVLAAKEEPAAALRQAEAQVNQLMR